MNRMVLNKILIISWKMKQRHVDTKNFHHVIMNKIKPIVKEKETELLNRA